MPNASSFSSDGVTTIEPDRKAITRVTVFRLRRGRGRFYGSWFAGADVGALQRDALDIRRELESHLCGVPALNRPKSAREQTQDRHEPRKGTGLSMREQVLG